MLQLQTRKLGAKSQMGLISRAEAAGYEVLVTCDQNVRYQQNLEKRVISIVVLGSNNWSAIQPTIGLIAQVVDCACPYSYEFVEIAPKPRKRRL
jgi:hypothetical protein